MPCVLTMCSCANVPGTLTCSCANVSCMLTMCLACSHANVPCVLTCQLALHAYMLMFFSFAATVTEVILIVGKGHVNYWDMLVS